MTSNLVSVVWVGHASANIPMPGMFGGTAPAQIWHDFMASAVNRDTCKDWPTPKQPFVGEPFFGEFAGKKPSVADDKNLDGNNDPTTTTPQEQDGDGTGDGGTPYAPPDAYETPPAPDNTQIQPDGDGTGVGTGGGEIGGAAPGAGAGTGNGNGDGNG
jgi:penicillin-binding protein 1A